MNRIKRRVYEIIEFAAPDDRQSRIFDIFIITLIVINIFAVILETVKSLKSNFSVLFYYIEIFSVVIFTIEYLLRLWSCVIDKRYNHPLKGRLRFVFSMLPMIDLAAIIPFYLPMVFVVDLRFLRALRLFRLFRLFKLGRYSSAMRILKAVLTEKKEELLIAVFAVFILLIFASSMMYYVENSAQPDRFSSIPVAMWWGVATLTTVGYGDVYPITSLGRFLGAIIALMGIGIFALPAGILASGFSERIRKETPRYVRCPQCGETFPLEETNKGTYQRFHS